MGAGVLCQEHPERAIGKSKTMAYVRHNQFRAPNGRTIFDWFTGTGFLSVDAGAFFVALMVLLPWNLYHSPGDLWVAQPLRTWAFVLTFHALIVGAIALAKGIAGSPEPERTPTSPRLRASSTWSSPTPTASNQQTASTLIAQEWARRWLEDDQAEIAGMMRQSEEISTRASHEPIASTPRWSSEATPWPDAPAPRSSIDAEAILADWLDEQASEYVAPASADVDPLKSAASVRTETGNESALDPELEWKWVEAAASAWLSRHEGAPDDRANSNGHS